MPTTVEVFCPKCEGPMWDNRATKRNPKAPDFKCKDASCDGAIWPPKNGAPPRAAAPVKQPFSSGAPLPWEGEETGAPPKDEPPHEKLQHLFAVYAACEDHILATSVQKFTKAQVGASPESIAAQIATLYIDARKAGV